MTDLKERKDFTEQRGREEGPVDRGLMESLDSLVLEVTMATKEQKVKKDVVES